MKKIFILKGLDCPNCAAKIQREVGEINGVDSSVVNLMNQSLTVEFSKEIPDLSKNIAAIVHSHEPEVEILDKEMPQSHNSSEESNKSLIIRLIIGALVFAAGIAASVFLKNLPLIELALLITAYIILGGDVVIKALRNITKGRVFDENFLMSLSTIGAFIIGEYHEAVAVMLFYQIGEFFQDMSVRRSRKSISDLMDIRPDSARVQRNGEFMVISPEEVEIGETIIIQAGEKIPLDGIVISGESMLDTSALTGESVPRAIRKGDTVLSGCINQSGVIGVEVRKPFGESTVAKIIDLVENASARKAPTENFITSFAKYYTPIVVILAAMLAFIPPLFAGDWAEWIHRGMVFLVISCPCALVISIPLAFFGGIGAAGKHGVLIKGGNFLEALNYVETIVFDKTGTLTKGIFEVSEIISDGEFTKEQVLEYAAYAESYSNHPIAKSIISAYGKETKVGENFNYTEFSGKGVCAIAENKRILAGNSKLMNSENINFAPCDKAGTKVYVAVDGIYAGCIIIADEIKADSKKTIEGLNQLGITNTIMLTGDDEKIAKSVANELNISKYFAGLLPHQKVETLEKLQSQNSKNGKTVFVGDGINDAPVLARADVGVAMGGLGSDAAIEAADVVLMTDEPHKLLDAIKIAKETKKIVIQNIVFALGVKGVFLILGAFGIAGMWEAVFGDVGVALLAVFNSMRVLKK